MEAVLAPVRKTLVVDCTPEQAFRTFTEGILTWWPFATHSIHSETPAAVVWGDEDGRVVEQHADGRKGTWGELLVWEPGRRLVMNWYPGRGPEDATELEVRFEPDGEKTRVELEHRYFERRGEQAAEARESYNVGWDAVLGCYAGSVGQ